MARRARIPRSKLFKKRRMYKKRRTVLKNRALSPFAQRFITRMKYSEVYTASNASGQAVWRLNLNSIFDPNRTGIGNQPYGHDTMASIYNRYRVFKCSYVINAYSAIGAPLQLAALPGNEEIALPSCSVYRESPRCQYGIQLNNANKLTLKGTVNLPSLVGRNKAQYMADDRYQAQFGTSPNELAVLNLCAQSMLESSLSDPQVTFAITLIYHVECFDVKQLPQS